ncbi:MAG: hypothetical protein WDZ96_00205 [Acidimicrobiia bacterium]
MQQDTAASFWKSQGRNFMTPYVREYIETPKFWIELSEGTGFSSNPIFGVSVALSGGVRDHELSQVFGSLEDATAHINSLVHEKVTL